MDALQGTGVRDNPLSLGVRLLVPPASLSRLRYFHVRQELVCLQVQLGAQTPRQSRQECAETGGHLILSFFWQLMETYRNQHAPKFSKGKMGMMRQWQH
jgi:hypothetical protein